MSLSPKACLQIRDIVANRQVQSTKHPPDPQKGICVFADDPMFPTTLNDISNDICDQSTAVTFINSVVTTSMPPPNSSVISDLHEMYHMALPIGAIQKHLVVDHPRQVESTVDPGSQNIGIERWNRSIAQFSAKCHNIDRQHHPTLQIHGTCNPVYDIPLV